MSAVAEAISPTSAPEVIDIEALLAPIPGDNPAGEDQRYSGLYDEIREARRADEDLAQGEWKRELKVADWKQVIELATDALATKTKDLQICAWLDEALVKKHGFVGLRDGLKLMRGLHERYWDNVYPEIDEGDMEARANSLAWMDAQLALAIKEVQLTNHTAGANYNYIQWEQAKEFNIPENIDALGSTEQEQAQETRQRAAAEGKITSEQWRISKNVTRRAFYENLYLLINECREEFRALDRVMDEKFGRQTPGLGALQKSLGEIHALIEALVKEKRVAEPDPVPEGAAATDGSGPEEAAVIAGDGSVMVASGPVRSRQEALKRLGEVAEYFRRTEPHSPVSYLVQRAIKWGQMPLETWLEDVIKDPGVLDQMRETLGLKSGSNGSE
jgi:type VI secretion system protein ImpA